MPLYEYHNSHTGQITCRILPVAKRDCVPPHLKRITVPDGVSTPRGVPNPGDVDEGMRRALRDLECRQPSQHFDKFERDHGFSKAHLKKVWSPEWTSTVE
jgi:hypothetical protein